MISLRVLARCQATMTRRATDVKARAILFFAVELLFILLFFFYFILFYCFFFVCVFLSQNLRLLSRSTSIDRLMSSIPGSESSSKAHLELIEKQQRNKGYRAIQKGKHIFVSSTSNYRKHTHERWLGRIDTERLLFQRRTPCSNKCAPDNSF